MYVPAVERGARNAQPIECLLLRKVRSFGNNHFEISGFTPQFCDFAGTGLYSATKPRIWFALAVRRVIGSARLR